MADRAADNFTALYFGAMACIVLVVLCLWCSAPPFHQRFDHVEPVGDGERRT